jgi:hypothetical protein
MMSSLGEISAAFDNINTRDSLKVCWNEFLEVSCDVEDISFCSEPTRLLDVLHTWNSRRDVIHRNGSTLCCWKEVAWPTDEDQMTFLISLRTSKAIAVVLTDLTKEYIVNFIFYQWPPKVA